MSADAEIPNFNRNEDIEELLDEDISELDRETLLDVQRYKSRKLKAKQDAGLSSESPSWEVLYPADDREITRSFESRERSESTETGGEDGEDTASGQLEYYASSKKSYEKEPASGGDSNGETGQTSQTVRDQTPSPSGSNQMEPPRKGITESGLSRSELESALLEYHDEIVELKDEIADLREENARLNERLRS
ncbi:MAG: hypothetical protein ABEH89_00080 [bacterium]